MCMGGPKPGGSSASRRVNAPPVSSDDALTDIRKLPMSIERPSPGRRMSGRGADSAMSDHHSQCTAGSRVTMQVPMETDVIARNHVTVLGRGTQPMLFAHGFGCDQN